jgi:protein O-GlcNAc transferase
MAALTYGELVARGLAHRREGRAVDAVPCFRQAARLAPQAPDPRFHLGEALWQLGLLADAIAAWRDACSVAPSHPASYFALGEALLATGDAQGAAQVAKQLRALGTDTPRRAAIEAIAALMLAAGDSADVRATRTAAAAELVGAVRGEPTLASAALLGGALAAALDRLPPGAERDACIAAVVDAAAPVDAATVPPGLLALVCEHMPAQADREMLYTPSLQRGYLASDHDALRRIARAAADAMPALAGAFAQCYATLCMWAFAPPMPLKWPRRTAGARTRVVVLVDSRAGADADETALALAGLPNDVFALTLAAIGGSGNGSAIAATAQALRCAVLELPRAADAAVASGRRVASLDADVVVDLAGLGAPTGPLLAQRPARAHWTVASLAAPNSPPLVDWVAVDAAALCVELRRVQGAREAMPDAPLDAAATAAMWAEAVRTHQNGNRGRARELYAAVLAQQPGYAPAHYLMGIALRDDGDLRAAQAAFDAAVEADPGYVEARAAAARTAIDIRRPRLAASLCETGIARAPNHAGLWRALGLARLALRDGAGAAQAFSRALALAPADGETHYNHGVALQMHGNLAEAARAYQRALTFKPGLVAADFNLGVLFQAQGATDAAIAAYDEVLRADPHHVAAYRNRGEALLGAGRIDAWLANFARFEASCPTALPLAVQALEACAYLPDFGKLDRYLDGLRQEKFRAADELELVDALEQLLYLLHFHDVEPSTLHKFAQTYDEAARSVYGEPLPRPTERRPGRLRLGYLSADLRNHVQGKMVWQAVERHDRARFELCFYSLSAQEDAWTERFRSIADRYEVVASLDERSAARRLAADDLDLLVDLSTHTKGAKPGILALKPARVQITHVASAGSVGLSTIDYKLTDRYADLPENQPFQIERMLPMDGCVYPYRHIAPAVEHPFHRQGLGLAPRTIVIGAFVSALKLSRRCLALWRDVLARLPAARLAFSPLNPALRTLYARIAAAGGIPAGRLLFLPQGRTDEENQARYTVVDFVLDTMPNGGVNGTLEALDMGVPVVTLVGKRHGERTSYSILANLGVTHTLAHSGRDYVDIAVRLGRDPAFMGEVRAAIRVGLAGSPLTDMAGHTRNLERAYLAALARSDPAALAAAAPA